MTTVTVPVLKPLTHKGRSYVRGDLVTVPAVEALALARRRLVSLTKGVKIMKAAQPEAPSPPTRRTYRRRDLRAGTDYATVDLNAEPRS